MKKFYVFAAVAIAALASCTKSEVVYNQGQQEIGFRQFTGSMTKAEALSGYASTMGVFAYHNGSTAYINNGSFKETTTTGTWGGDPTKYYWPLQGTLDFTVYAPHQATGVEYFLNDMKLKVTIADNSGEQQIDYLYGKVQYNRKTKTNSPVSVVLKHALSKVTINVGASANDIFTVSSVLLKNTYQNGSYEVSYTSTDDNTSKVATSGGVVDMEFVEPSSPWTPTTTVTNCTASKLVVPSAQTSIVLKYKMAGSDRELEATVNLASESAKWVTGTHYTYNLTLTATEILFSPEVEIWTPASASDHTIG